MINKRTDFLWIVQMIMIKYQPKIVGWPGVAGDAVAASHRIPAGMTAREAALAFCGAFVEGFSGDVRADVPAWMTNLSDPADGTYKNSMMEIE